MRLSRLTSLCLSLGGLWGLLLASSACSSPQVAKISCAPLEVELGNGDKLQLKLPPEHGAELSVSAPNGDYYLVVFERLSSHALPPVISPEVFRSLTEVELAVDEQIGYRFAKGVQEYEPIFSVQGMYEVRISTNLATEPSQANTGTCKIEVK